MARVDIEDLKNIDNLDKLADIFTHRLNYDYELSPISTRYWKEDLADSILDRDIKLLAKHEDFHIIYCRIENLLLGVERPIVNQLLKEHPYLLVIFADKFHKNLHFVNIKYDEEVKNRKIYRRISIGPEERLHTAAQRINMLEIKDEEISSLGLQDMHDKAFDVEAVGREFYSDYDRLFNYVQDIIRGRESEENVFLFTHLLFNRLMFLYFIQRKGWFNHIDSKDTDLDFLNNLWKYYKGNTRNSHGFYNRLLRSLFFEAFKGKYSFSRSLPSELITVYSKMPHLNGGLFQEEDVDDIEFLIPDEVFENLIGDDGLFQHYNFTVREDLPLDKEVALDHDMLGAVYETVVNKAERSSAGMFYTPQVEVDLMCRLSLINSLRRENLVPDKELVHFIINGDYPELAPQLEKESLEKLRDKLLDLKIVDPACGSGAFLVGMIKAISGIVKTIDIRLGKTEIDLFQYRKRIIGRNLYGVDVKPWAVKICELRLWLTLIVEADETKLDLRKPLLPNLDYNIRQGDSLIEEIIPGHQIVIRSDYTEQTLLPELKGQLTKIQGMKEDYYNNKGNVTKRQIAFEQKRFLSSFFIRESQRLQQRIENLRKAKLESENVQNTFDFAKKSEQDELEFIKAWEEERKSEIAELETKLGDYKSISHSFNVDKKEKGYFLWDLDFAELFYKNKGFDIVISNPPYVRQEEIAPPTDYPEHYPPERWREKKAEYKEKLIQSVRTHWKGVSVDRKCDLYIYFYLHALALLKPGGTFCFITSNSWLDVNYGKVLQEFLLRNIEIKAIIDNQAKRVFATADINTIIALFERPDDLKKWSSDREKKIVRFAMFKKPFETSAGPENMEIVLQNNEKINNDVFRVLPISQGDLFLDGIDEMMDKGESLLKDKMSSRYVGNKWGGKYLRAPDIFFTILEKGKGKLVRLGDIAKVTRGFTTGVNEFFYLDEEKIRERKIEKEFLEPVIKSPRECRFIVINPKDLQFRVFMCHKSKAELKGTNALKYIEWGEQRKFNKNPTCAVRNRWYDLNVKDKSQIFIIPIVNDFVRSIVNGEGNEDIVFNSDVVLNVYYKQKIILAVILNSTITQLFTELEGRRALGGGALKLQIYEASKLYVINPEIIDRKHVDELRTIFKRLKNREIKSIFEECGFNPRLPIRDQEPNPLPDRKELDNIIFDILGLTKEERKEVYWSVCELVKTRLEKAKSV